MFNGLILFVVGFGGLAGLTVLSTLLSSLWRVFVPLTVALSVAYAGFCIYCEPWRCFEVPSLDAAADPDSESAALNAMSVVLGRFWFCTAVVQAACLALAVYRLTWSKEQVGPDDRDGAGPVDRTGQPGPSAPVRASLRP